MVNIDSGIGYIDLGIGYIDLGIGYIDLGIGYIDSGIGYIDSGIGLLPEWQLDPKEHTLMTSYLIFKSFNSCKCI